AGRPTFLHKPAGASLRNRGFRAHHFYRLPLHLRAYHFFVTTACNARLSSSSSATACFSCRFSSSSCRSRRASLTSIPPYFAFQRYRLPPVIPCRRHSFRLPQDGDDLFFVKSTLAHDSSSLALSGPS